MGEQGNAGAKVTPRLTGLVKLFDGWLEENGGALRFDEVGRSPWRPEGEPGRRLI